MLLYLYYKNNQLNVVRTSGTEKHNMSFQRYLNSLLLYELTDYSSRIKATNKLFDFKSKTPIVIDKETILFCSSNIRNYENIIINYKAIEKVEKIGSRKIIIYFKYGHTIKTDMSYYSFQKYLEKIDKIVEYFSGI